MNFDIPPGLTDLLQDFTVSVLRNRPTDLYQFAADYFADAYQHRLAGDDDGQTTNFRGGKAGGGGGITFGGASNDMKHSTSPHSDSDDDDIIGTLLTSLSAAVTGPREARGTWTNLSYCVKLDYGYSECFIHILFGCVPPPSRTRTPPVRPFACTPLCRVHHACAEYFYVVLSCMFPISV